MSKRRKIDMGQSLFEHMYQEYGLTLTGSQMNEIVHVIGQRIDIGKFGLCDTDDYRKVWITNFESGDGGGFSVKKLEKVLDEFYAKEF